MKKTKKSSNKSSSALHGEQKRKRRLVLWCVSFALAFVFWLYVAGASDVPIEETYDLIEIEYDSTLIAPHGLVVQSISIDTVNVTIMGSQRDIKSVVGNGISAKISLKNITEPGEYSLPVTITTPDRTTVTHQTVESVNVTVDRPSEKTFGISFLSVETTDYTLEPGCHLGNHILSESAITVKGPTLVLDTVQSVKVRTASIGSATNGKKVTAQIVLLDANGKEINNKNLSISENARDLTVTLSVYMEKTVKLTASGKHGYYGKDNFSVNPSEVTLVGAPEVLADISEINVFTIDEKKTPINEDKLGLVAEAYTLPSGVSTLDGKTKLEGVTVDVYLANKVNYRDIKLYPDDIEVDSSKGFVAKESITVRVYFSASADPDMPIPASGIYVYVDARELSSPGVASALITVSENLKGYIYVLDTDSRTVSVGVPEVKDNAPSVDGDATPLSN